ncbi:MAG: hypothetical protein KME13_23920 [Myxacorys californica WJT36-NPBG1]|nr:hypothetical protein [Myxacorys californica WJT36-NPBG1]
MTQPDPQNERIERLEVDMLDVKTSLNRLIDITFENGRYLQTTMQAVDRLAQAQQQHMEHTDQRFNEVLTRIDEMQSEVRGLQTENRRIWEILSRQQGE